MVTVDYLDLYSPVSSEHYAYYQKLIILCIFDSTITCIRLDHLVVKQDKRCYHGYHLGPTVD